ncbi:hypothetical protein OESDEN_10750, partial [Oesophagostomum dentatum]
VIDFCNLNDRTTCGPGTCVFHRTGNRCKCPDGWMGRKCAKLPLTLPPILDNIAWFVGRWECKTTAGERFPEPLSGPYREVLEVQLSEVPMFDRPPVNVSATAVTTDGHDIRNDVGFMTSKPFNEDTGFVEFDKPKEGDDK